LIVESGSPTEAVRACVAFLSVRNRYEPGRSSPRRCGADRHRSPTDESKCRPAAVRRSSAAGSPPPPASGTASLRWSLTGAVLLAVALNAGAECEPAIRGYSDYNSRFLDAGTDLIGRAAA